jgi:AraC family transcriptional regulator
LAVPLCKTRLRLASEALALPERSIEEIADDFGFPNRYSFTRRFSRRFGCGPAEFRARQRENRGR